MNNFTSLHHTFDIHLAQKYGIEEAILIQHFQHWIQINRNDGRNRIEGRTWTYQTRKNIAEHFIYLSSTKVRRITDRLVKLKILRKGNFNKSKFDKTIWYAFENENMFTIGKVANGGVEIGNGGVEIGTPIPDTTSNTTPNTTLDMEHMEGKAQNAHSMNELDELGQPQFIPPPLRGKALDVFNSLSIEQKQGYTLIMNILPIKGSIERFNAAVAVRLAENVTLDRIRKSILVFQQRIERGFNPRSLGAFNDIISKGYEPEPPHATKNRVFWQKYKEKLPGGSYKEHPQEVEFTFYPNKVLPYSISEEIFRDQLRRNVEDFLKQKE